MNTYWYQCVYCLTLLKSNKPLSQISPPCPNIRTKRHHWSKLAETGNITLQCSKCKSEILVKDTNRIAVLHCRNGGNHNWRGI